jgi:CheY-like chemotaxis protein
MAGFFRNSNVFGFLKRRLVPEIEKLVLLNNELQAANEQLRARNRELTQSAGELGNFLTSAGLPVLIVGRDLRIRTLTSSVERLLNLQPTDLGRPIADLHPIVAFPDLAGIINDVINNDRAQEHEVQCLNGRWYLLRVHPYRMTDGSIDGAIMLFFDIELHGGAIDVRSAGPGAGSEFTVRLPGVVLASESDTETLQSHTAHADDSLRRILLVDDWLVAYSFEIILKNLGHEVCLAHDGPNAIEAVQTFHPDVIMVDISMPGIDGYEVARHIRAQPEFDGIVLVAQTGYGTEADALRAQEAGFDYHLTKPVELGMLQKILADVQRKHVKR